MCNDIESLRLLAVCGIAVAVVSCLVVALVLLRCRSRCRELSRMVRRERSRERGRIARELHDVAGHRLLAIVLHARKLLSEVPDARSTAELVEELAVLTQRDIRTVLGVLRATDRDAAFEVAPLGTSDTAAGNQPLSTSVVALGIGLPDVDLTVRLSEVEREHGLRPSARHAALRVVQEGITNAIKHGSGPISVHVDFGVELDVSVINGPVGGSLRTAPPRPRTGEDDRGPGRGLRGLRDRVAELGGTVEYGALDSGGFRVRARVPTGKRTGPAGEGLVSTG